MVVNGPVKGPVQGAAGKSGPRSPGESGQSLLEFLLLLPLLLGLTVVLLRVNTAIQSAIVNQQYSRAQTLTLASNSAVYPRVAGQRVPNFDKKGYNKMVLGISEESTDPNEENEKHPSAPTVSILRRSGALQGSDESQQDGPPERTNIRIRTSTTLCTQINVSGGQPLLTIAPGKVGGTATDVWKLADNTQFNYCGGPQ